MLTASNLVMIKYMLGQARKAGIAPHIVSFVTQALEDPEVQGMIANPSSAAQSLLPVLQRIANDLPRTLPPPVHIEGSVVCPHCTGAFVTTTTLQGT